MYKLYIVDDEAAIRSGIEKSIPWSKWGFEVIAVCADGLEAVNQLESNMPDVVLSDIRMPNMDGVQLMQHLNSNYPHIKIVISSGYSDFEYLNMSIKSKVTEYLLKPTDIDEFEQVFKRLKQKMDEERAQSRDYDESVNRHFTNWLSDLFAGTALDEDTARFMPSLVQKGISLENAVVAVINVDERSGDEQRTVNELKRRIAEIIAEVNCEISFTYFLTNEGVLAGIYSVLDDNNIENSVIKRHIEKIQASVKQNTTATVSAGISNLCSETDMLPQAFEQANCCAGQSLFTGNESIFFFDMLDSERPESLVYFETEIIQKSLLAQDYDALKAELERVFHSFGIGPMREYHFVDRMCLSLLFHVSLWGLQYNVFAEDVLRSLGTTYTDIYRCDSLQKKKDFVLSILFAVQMELGTRREKGKSTNSVANRVRDFVDMEFCKNVMSLDYVAAHVQKSVAYVSRVFKNELGCNFSDYLTEKRVKKAIELLADHNLKIYEIAQQCGYADTSNFIKVFKKSQGISPSEYRNAVGEQ